MLGWTPARGATTPIDRILAATSGFGATSRTYPTLEFAAAPDIDIRTNPIHDTR